MLSGALKIKEIQLSNVYFLKNKILHLIITEKSASVTTCHVITSVCYVSFKYYFYNLESVHKI